MNIDGKLLRETLEIALANDNSFPNRFYELLFEAHPELRAMFTRNSSGAQRKMFAQKLTAIVDHFEDARWLEHELSAVARSHAQYGATAEMYPWVGDAIIRTVREACADEWTEAAEAAWQTAYRAITETILRTPTA